MQQTTPADPAITVEHIHQLVHQFYARVRRDPLLAPIFNGHIREWDAHLQKLVDFWAWLVLRQNDFKGEPMPKHARLPGLTWRHFEQWLKLFEETTSELELQELKAVVDPMAQRIAARLWEHYRSQRHPEVQIWQTEIPPDLTVYKSSPVFSHDKLPAALRNTHSTKSGAWGVVRMLSGSLVFTQDEDPPRTILLEAGMQLLVQPQSPHHVEFVSEGSFQIDFCSREPE